MRAAFTLLQFNLIVGEINSFFFSYKSDFSADQIRSILYNAYKTNYLEWKNTTVTRDWVNCTQKLQSTDIIDI